MNDEMRRLAANSGRLLAVTGLAMPTDRFVALNFQFESGALILSCDDDTDEIIAEVTLEPSKYPTVHHEFLSSLLGSTLEYLWSLTNHRGYEDALQLRFARADGDDATVQFEVAASTMDAQRVGC